MVGASSLEARLLNLESEVAILQETVRRQSRLIRDLIALQGGESEFELLEAAPALQSAVASEPAGSARASAAAALGGSASSAQRAHTPEPTLSSSPRASAQAAAAPGISSEERAHIAREVGQFLRRCLDGLPLKTSGRDRNPLRNRHYIVCQDFEGVRLSPPLITDRFEVVRARCKRGSELGRSVFVGLPSLWESGSLLRLPGSLAPSDA